MFFPIFHFNYLIVSLIFNYSLLFHLLQNQYFIFLRFFFKLFFELYLIFYFLYFLDLHFIIDYIRSSQQFFIITKYIQCQIY